MPTISRITKEELKTKLDKKEELVIIDVRTDEAYNVNKQKIKGAIHIPLNELEKNINNIPKGKEIITYCA